MVELPQEAKLLKSFSIAFTKPTFQRFLVLAISAIITMGRRTVSRLLWSAGPLAEGHPSSYHRFFSAARFAMFPAARVLAAMVLELIPKDQAVVLDVDDTVAAHGGKHVFGKGCHRDGVRSSWSRTVFKFGHKWVILAVNVKLPCCRRAWALPILAALYTPPAGSSQADSAQEDPPTPTSRRRSRRSRGGGRRSGGNRPKLQASKAKASKPKASKSQESKPRPKPWSKFKAGDGLRHLKDGPRHKTPPLLARQLLAMLIHWFPDRRFILLGDWGFASFELALFCHRHRKHVSLIARTRSDMNLFALPPAAKRPGRGRKAIKGRKLPHPKEAAANASRRARFNVAWYGNSRRDLELISACAGWYRGRGGGRAALIPVRWVYVHDPKTGRQDWFYTTDTSLTAPAIVEGFAARWAIEVTFQEVRAHLGFESTRQRCKSSVLRSAPCILGLFTLVSLLWAKLAEAGKGAVQQTPCYHKSDPTFADALICVRRMLWEQVILPQCPEADAFTQLPQCLRQTLLEHLAVAA